MIDDELNALRGHVFALTFVLAEIIRNLPKDLAGQVAAGLTAAAEDMNRTDSAQGVPAIESQTRNQFLQSFVEILPPPA